MVSPPDHCWSFVYAVGGSRFSLEVQASTLAEAQARVEAMSGASPEGEIMPSPLVAELMNEGAAA